MGKEYLKYKRYAHFDKKMSVKKAKRLLKCDDTIKEHGFFPFIHYSIESKKLETVNNKVYAKKEPKKREIYYCAHMDRYIYQHYAYILGLKYNEYMVKSDIDRCSGAYRIERGKCNIDFSHEVFEFIKEKEEAVVIIGDFTKFFDNLDHKKLKNRIEKILSSKIDDNLYKVFKSLTKFKYVNIEDLYDYYTVKNNKRSEKYYMRKLDTLMSVDEFKKFINGNNTKTNEKYLKENKNSYGIVQGSPLSGLLANIYMIEFDKEMNELAMANNGLYLRYSDDFILVLDNNDNEKIQQIYQKIQSNVNEAKQISLEEKKTNIYRYKESRIECLNNEIFMTENVPNIINFLGFSFDGSKITIRSKTMSKYYYKMTRKIKKYIKGKNGITIKDIYNKFSLQGENKKNSGGNKGNFITYVKRAEMAFKNEDSIKSVRTNSKKKVTEKIGTITKKEQLNK